MNTRGTNEHSVTVGLPAQYDLLDRDGNQVGRFETAQRAGEFARYMWPKQEQDPDRTGTGWDVEFVR